MVVSTIGTRKDAMKLAELLKALAHGFRCRTEPLDADASILDQIGDEIAIAAEFTKGDWPHGVLTQGRVLVWSSSLMSAIKHIEEQTGHELEATLGHLRRRALELKGHAQGLRATGTWAVSGEMTAPSEPAPEPEPPPLDPDEELELADTAKIRPLPPRAKPSE